MTSGNFRSFPIEEIWLDRSKRQRRELVGIEDLADSIKRTGLINPPVIKNDGELVAGERRYTACKLLGWTAIPVQFVEELSEVELHLVEYEENVRRTDLPWQDQCLAIKRYTELRRQQTESWTTVDTSRALGISNQEASLRTMVANAIDEGNERVINSPQYSTARGIVERDVARKKSSILSTISLTAPVKPGEAPDIVKQEEARRVAPLLNLDFHEWSLAYDGPLFNLIHCDFPYGVGMDKSDQGAASGFGSYSDNPDVFFDLIRSLSASMGNVVAPSAHLIFWFSMDFYEVTRVALEEMGWKINKFPLVWIKSDNTGILPDPTRGPRRIYETAFFGSRGDRPVVGPVANAFSAPGRGKEIHMNEKPVVMLQHFLRMFCDKYSLVLDPTAGSANALKAATALGANHVLGLERDPEFYQRSVDLYWREENDL